MKKTYIIGFLTLLLTTNALVAQQITQTEAQNVAINFYGIQQKAEKLVGWDRKATLVQTNLDSEIPSYTFEINNDFVSVSADKKNKPIIAFSLDGKFKMPTKPIVMGKGLNRDFETKILKIESAYQIDTIVRVKRRNRDYSGDWNKYENRVFTRNKNLTDDVEPLTTTTWGQEEYYNDSMPAHPDGPGGNVMVGCVSVAMGQYMKYVADTYGTYTGYGAHEWTWNGWGEWPPSAWYPTQYADFANADYDYALMPNQLTNITGADSIAEVSRFLADLGVSINMQYGPSSSGTGTMEAWYAMVNYFSFNVGNREYTREYYYDDSDKAWYALLMNTLNDNDVILYSGVSDNHAVSHAFIIDGYLIESVSDDTLFHCNLGWDGNWDGYYSLEFLSFAGFVPLDKWQSAILGMRPDSININADTTISGIWEIERDINIRETAKLIIEPGTTIKIAEGAEFLISGTIHAVGTPTEPIKFTVSDPEYEMFNSIRLQTYPISEEQESAFKHCIIENSFRRMKGCIQWEEMGGGIYVRGMEANSITFEDIEIRNCKAIFGGGAYIVTPGYYKNLDIHNCSTGNTYPEGWYPAAFWQGGGLAAGPFTWGSDLLILDSCLLSNNIAEGFGGALWTVYNTVLVKNTIFENNKVSWGGGLAISSSENLLIQNCTFKNHFIDWPYPQGIIYAYDTLDVI